MRLILQGLEFAAGANACECITPTGVAIFSYIKAEKISNFHGEALRNIGRWIGRRDRKDRPNVLFSDKGGISDYNYLY